MAEASAFTLPLIFPLRKMPQPVAQNFDLSHLSFAHGAARERAGMSERESFFM